MICHEIFIGLMVGDTLVNCADGSSNLS